MNTMSFLHSFYVFYTIFIPETYMYWSNGIGHWSGRPGFNPMLSHTKVLKLVLDASLLNTQHYKVWIKRKMSNPVKGVAPSSISWSSSYWKGSLQSLSTTVGQCNNLYIYIYIYIYIYKQLKLKFLCIVCRQLDAMPIELNNQSSVIDLKINRMKTKFMRSENVPKGV